MLDRILLNHPNCTKSGISSERDLRDYFDVINSLPDNIMVQPNRAHFFLGTFFREYDSKVIHIVRHPLDVFLSMKKAYLNNPVLLKRLARKVLHPFIIHDNFDVKKDYEWIMKHTGYPYASYDNWNLKYIRKLNYFDKFVAVWTISNYYAIKSIQENHGLLVVYEELIRRPKDVLQQICDYLDIGYKSLPEIKKDNCFKFANSNLKKLERSVSRYKIGEQFHYVVNQINYNNIDYLREY
jgi:hypothetical protein